MCKARVRSRLCSDATYKQLRPGAYSGIFKRMQSSDAPEKFVPLHIFGRLWVFKTFYIRRCKSGRKSIRFPTGKSCVR